MAESGTPDVSFLFGLQERSTMQSARTDACILGVMIAYLMCDTKVIIKG
jgi:hypothetical protein